MSRMITLRLSDETYERVKLYAADDQQSMNSWIEGLLAVEDLRRRCQAHGDWLRRHPDAVTAAEAWADDALTELTNRSA